MALFVVARHLPGALLLDCRMCGSATRVARGAASASDLIQRFLAEHLHV